MKTCTKCNIEKPFEAFFKNKRAKDGYKTECKECYRERIQELKKNPLKQLERQIKSSIILENKLLAKEGKRLCCKCNEIFLIEDITMRGSCKNCDIEHQKEYYLKNKDKKKEYQKEYIEKNKDKVRNKRREYLEKNKDKRREYYEKNKDKIKEYAEKNKDKIKEYQKEYGKEYRDKNRDKIKEINKKYRLKKKLEKENNIKGIN